MNYTKNEIVLPRNIEEEMKERSLSRRRIPVLGLLWVASVSLSFAQEKRAMTADDMLDMVRIGN